MLTVIRTGVTASAWLEQVILWKLSFKLCRIVLGTLKTPLAGCTCNAPTCEWWDDSVRRGNTTGHPPFARTPCTHGSSENLCCLTLLLCWIGASGSHERVCQRVSLRPAGYRQPKQIKSQKARVCVCVCVCVCVVGVFVCDSASSACVCR